MPTEPRKYIPFTKGSLTSLLFKFLSMHVFNQAPEQDIVSLFQILEENQTYQTVRKLFVSSRLLPGKKHVICDKLLTSCSQFIFCFYKETPQRVEVICKICNEVLQFDTSKLLSIVRFSFLLHCGYSSRTLVYDLHHT